MTAATTPQPKRPTPAELRAGVTRAFTRFESFCGLLEILDKSGRRVPFRLNRTQRRYVLARTRRDVVLKSRQVGLTVVILALMLYRFLTVPGASVGIVVQSMTGNPTSKNIAAILELYIQSLERKGVSFDFVRRTDAHWELKNGAKLQILEAGGSEKVADKKGRSQRFTHLHLTEVAYWEYAEQTLDSILECVSEGHGTEIVMECTANGASGPFFEHCQMARKGTSGYAFHFFPWYVHEEYEVTVGEGEKIQPRTDWQRALVRIHKVSAAALKWWQAQVGKSRGDEEHVTQEYPSDPDTCFLVSGRTFFDKGRIIAALQEPKVPVTVQQIRETGVVQMRDGSDEVPALRVFHPPVPGEDYVVAADTSEGVGGSAGGALVLERRTARHMATLWGQFQPWALGKWAVLVARKYNGALLAVERNNHGHTVLRAAAAEYKYRRIFVDRDERPGWLNNGATRAPALDTVEDAFREGYLDIGDVHVLREMRTFVTVQKGASIRAQAAKGARDDTVMMLAIGYDVLTRPTQKAKEDWTRQLPAG
jgi:hypothetical protein